MKKSNDNMINAAVQLLPGMNKEESWRVIDKAIELIAVSGLKYKVCPFETVMEGSYGEIVGIIDKISNMAFEESAEEIIINVKFHFGKNKDILISDKMRKYQD